MHPCAHTPGVIFFVIAEGIAYVGLFVFMLARYLPVQLAASVCLYLQLAGKHKRERFSCILAAIYCSMHPATATCYI